MASPQGDRERLRRERLVAERDVAAKARRRDILGYVAGGALVAVIAAGIIVAVANGGGGQDEEAGAVGDCENAAINAEAGTAEGLECDDREPIEPPPIRQGDPETAAAAADCEFRRDLAEEGTEHVPDAEQVNYKTNPPTSGPMYETPAADGAFLSAPPAPRVVHSLEHGRTVFQYDPGALDDEAERTLKGVFDELPFVVLMVPDEDMSYAVAATAWTQLLGCERWNDRVPDALRAFREEFRDMAPEPAGL
jgi:hypothetical protein